MDTRGHERLRRAPAIETAHRALGRLLKGAVQGKRRHRLITTRLAPLAPDSCSGTLNSDERYQSRLRPPTAALPAIRQFGSLTSGRRRCGPRTRCHRCRRHAEDAGKIRGAWRNLRGHARYTCRITPISVGRGGMVRAPLTRNRKCCVNPAAFVRAVGARQARMCSAAPLRRRADRVCGPARTRRLRASDWTDTDNTLQHRRSIR